MTKHNPMSNPIELTIAGWIFWNEAWTDFYGPFETKEECKVALKKYCKTL